MGKILTISIAAYNMENYIDQTLKSLIIPEIIDELEIFVIDDGGTDQTLEIARNYAGKYPDSIFPVHKLNEGLGSTFNYSIDHATGKFFKWLDGDDWFDSRGFYDLISMLKKTDADVVASNYYKGYDSDHLEEINIIKENSNGLIDIREMGCKYIFGMWALTYKTELLRRSNLRLPEHMFYVDQLFSVIPFSIAESIQLLKSYVYCYRVGREGQSISRESRIRDRQAFLDLCAVQCEYYEKNKLSLYAKEYLKMRISTYYCGAIKTLLLCPISKTSLNELRNYEKRIFFISKDIYENAIKCGKVGKLIFLFRKTHYMLYWMLRIIPGGFPNWS